MKRFKTKYLESARLLADSPSKNFVNLGEYLLYIRGQKLYSPQYRSFYDYVNDIGLSRATATKLIIVYTVFIACLDYSHDYISKVGQWSWLYEVAKFAKNKKNAAFWIAEIRVCKNRTDLRKRIKRHEARKKNK